MSLPLVNYLIQSTELHSNKCLEWELCDSVREMARQDYYAERSEAQEDKAEEGVDEAEEVRADAVRDKANDDG